MARLNHPGIASLYDVQELDGDLYLIMEFVAGRPLSGAGPMSTGDFFGIAIQCAQALAAAAESGIVHGDIKPSNLMITPSGDIKVLDFGVARSAPGGAVDSTSLSPTTDASWIAGSPPYMAPEVLEGEAPTSRSDLFSFGVVLFELLSGKHPFQGRSMPATVKKIVTDPPPSMTAAGASVSSELEALIAKLLRKDPNDRYHSALDVLAALRALRIDASRPGAKHSNDDGGPTRGAGVRAVGRLSRGAPALVTVLSAGGLALAARTCGGGEPPATVMVAPFPGTSVDTGAPHGTVMASIGLIAGLPVIDAAGVTDVAAAAAGDLPELLAAARRVGAKYLVTGQGLAPESGGTLFLRVDAVHGGTPLLQRTGGGGSESFPEALSRLSLEVARAIALMEGVTPRGGDAMLATTSVPALVQFANGQARFAEADVDGGAAAFRRAIELDSLFAPAYFRLSILEMWRPRFDFDEALRVVEVGLAKSEDMAPQWRQLLEAQRHYILRDAARSVSGFEQLTFARPGMVESWFGLGEAVYHLGPFGGALTRGARAPLDRVLQIEPSFMPEEMQLHMVDLDLLMGEPAAAERRAARLPPGSSLRVTADALLAASTDGPQGVGRLSALSVADHRTLTVTAALLARQSSGARSIDVVGTYLMAPGRNPDERLDGARYRLAAGAAQGWFEERMESWKVASQGVAFDPWVISADLAGWDVEDVTEPMYRRAAEIVARTPPQEIFGLPPTDSIRQALRAVVLRAFVWGAPDEVDGLIRYLDLAVPHASPADILPQSLAATLRGRRSLLAADTATAIHELTQAVSRIADPYTVRFPLTSMAAPRVRLIELLLATEAKESATRLLSSFSESWIIADLLYHPRVDALRRRIVDG